MTRIKDPLWAPVFVDDKTIIFLYRNKDNKEVIKKYELPKEMFGIKIEMQISIIIPIYNEEKTLKEVIFNTQKVFAQSKNDYEIILVNDGSKDKMREIISKISDPHIIAIHHETNYGKGRAIQSGVKKATGSI